MSNEAAKEDIYEMITKKAKYALKSRSRGLVHETYGAAVMARRLEAITNDEMWVLNAMLVKNGLNNPAAKLE